MNIVFATGNRGKQLELEALLRPLGFSVVSPTAAGVEPTVEEDAPTFAGNAEKKARHVSRSSGLPALADDSGLEVDALSGRPGVHSARYAGPERSDAANNAKLLAELAAVPDERRTARFRCALALALPDGQLLTVEGTCEGRILREPRGAGGFGYDPLFLVGDTGRTLAEMELDEKNRVSHRGRALRALIDRLPHPRKT